MIQSYCYNISKNILNRDAGNLASFTCAVETSAAEHSSRCGGDPIHGIESTPCLSEPTAGGSLLSKLQTALRNLLKNHVGIFSCFCHRRLIARVSPSYRACLPHQHCKTPENLRIYQLLPAVLTKSQPGICVLSLLHIVLRL